jgi:hypothetical protein
LPELVAEHRDGRAALLVFVGGEGAAARRVEAEHGEEVGGDVQAGHLLGLARALGEGEAVAGGHADLAEDILALAEELILGPGEGGCLEVPLPVECSRY